MGFGKPPETGERLSCSWGREFECIQFDILASYLLLVPILWSVPKIYPNLILRVSDRPVSIQCLFHRFRKNWSITICKLMMDRFGLLSYQFFRFCLSPGKTSWLRFWLLELHGNIRMGPSLWSKLIKIGCIRTGVVGLHSSYLLPKFVGDDHLTKFFKTDVAIGHHREGLELVGWRGKKCAPCNRSYEPYKFWSSYQ